LPARWLFFAESAARIRIVDFAASCFAAASIRRTTAVIGLSRKETTVCLSSSHMKDGT
jgi:hypothetical protein